MLLPSLYFLEHDGLLPEGLKIIGAARSEESADDYIAKVHEAVKARADWMVTSGSALDVVRHLHAEGKKILWAPDRYLGDYIRVNTGADMLLWQGSCIVHEQFSERELVKLMGEHPGAPVIAHPECPGHILQHADHVGSTSSILSYALTSDADTFIVVTEPHIIHQMQKKAPHKTFIGAPNDDGNCNCNNCPFMALNTMEKLYLCLANMTPQIEVPEDIRVKALRSVQRMLDRSPPVQPANIG